MPTLPPANRPGKRFVDWILANRMRSIGLGLLLIGLSAPGWFLIEYEYGHRSNYYEDNELLAEFDAFSRRFNGSDSLVVAVHSPSGIFTPDSAELLRELTEGMWQLPDILRVDSLTNYSWIHADGDDIYIDPLLDDFEFEPETLAERRKIALEHEVLPGYLISPDGMTALVFALPRAGPKGVEGVELLAATHALIDSLRRGDHEFYVSGDPALNNQFQLATATDTAILSPLISGLALLLLALFFRTWTGVVLPFVVVGATVGASMGLLGLLGVVFTPVSQAMPQVLIAICFADSIHVLVSFRLARAENASPLEAARYALSKNFVPTLLTSISTAVGFFSFATVQHKGLGGFGIGAGLGALAAWPFTYLLLGAALPSLRWAGSRPTPNRYVSSLMALATTHRTKVGVIAVALTAVLATLSLQLQLDSNALEYFKEGIPLRTASEFIEQEVGAAFSIEMVIDTHEDGGVKDPELLRRIDGFETWLEGRDEIAQTVSIVSILKNTNRALHGDDPEQYALPPTRRGVAEQLLLYEMDVPAAIGITDRMTVDQSAMRVTILWDVASAQRATRLLALYSETAATKFGLSADRGATVSFAGRYILFQRQVGLMIEAFVVSLVTAFAFISLMLVVYFRSLWLGALALVANLVPLLFGAAVLVLLDEPLNLGTVILSSVCLGIAVDDTIHIMASYRENLRKGLLPEAALENVLTHTLPALLVTTAVLVGVFGSFFFATIVPNSRFGVMSALILSAALVFDLAALPALLLSRFGWTRASADQP